MLRLYPGSMLTDLVQIRRLGEKKRDENLRFRKYLKSHNFVERQFRGASILTRCPPITKESVSPACADELSAINTTR